jgi:hypothetical protein
MGTEGVPSRELLFGNGMPCLTRAKSTRSVGEFQLLHSSDPIRPQIAAFHAIRIRANDVPRSAPMARERQGRGEVSENDRVRALSLRAAYLHPKALSLPIGELPAHFL